MASTHCGVDHTVCTFCTPFALDSVSKPVVLACEGVLVVKGFPGHCKSSSSAQFLQEHAVFLCKPHSSPIAPFMDVLTVVLSECSHSSGILCGVVTLLEAAEMLNMGACQKTVPKTSTTNFVSFALALGTFHLWEHPFVLVFNVNREHFFLSGFFRLVVVGSTNMPTTLENLAFRMVIFYCFRST